MLNSSWKVFVLAGTVLVVLLFLQLIPPISFLGLETRRVDMVGEVMNPPQEDTIPKKKDVLKKLQIEQNLYQPDGVTLFEDFSKGQEGGLDHFFSLLADSLPTDRTVNIAYYGDSFVEGDILTADLRELLQTRYGGSGPGWVEPGPNFGSFRASVNVSSSNVIEHAVVNKGFVTSQQGPSQRYYLLSRYAAFTVKGTSKYAHASKWQRMLLFLRSQVSSSLMYGPTRANMTVKTILPSEAVQTFVQTGKMNSLICGFGESPHDIQLLGLTLDGTQGIALDNFSMRGIPGYSLANLPLVTMQQIGRYRPYDLVIVHFGLNAVGAKSSDKEAADYIEKMKVAVNHMREAFPEASFLIVSVPDRDQRSAAGLHTIPQVKQLVGMQRRMAQELHVGFFNLYEAMGGDGSMAKLVDRGEANKDYTHLNVKGGKRLADLYYQSILAGVENHRRRMAAKGGEE